MHNKTKQVIVVIDNGRHPSSMNEFDLSEEDRKEGWKIADYQDAKADTQTGTPYLVTLVK